MKNLAVVVAKSGLLDPNVLAELKKWGLPVVDVPIRPMSPEDLSEAIREALESEDLVVSKLTDFDSIKQYLATQSHGLLHMVIEDGGETEFDISFGRTALGEYILPWRSESIKDEMTNGFTYLKDGGTKVYFEDVQEAYFGDTKAFMICRPSKERTDGRRH